MTLTLTVDWSTGDINTRSTQALAVINDAGVPKIVAPVQHGAACFDRDGTLLWTYNGITNSYDVREILAADLTGSGYADCSIILSGYYATSTDGKFAIVDKTGTPLQMFLGTAFLNAPSRCFAAAVDGTDIYIGSDSGITKFVKSGSTWTEDTTNWAKTVSGTIVNIKIDDAGNGKRIYAVRENAAAIFCYQTDGTLDWSYAIGGAYARDFAIARFDSSKTGKQIAVGKQSSLIVVDKDGSLSATITTSNVCNSVIAFDDNNDGVADLYHSDMGSRVVHYRCTAADTYTQQTILTGVITSGQYAGLEHYDINADGVDEIFIYTTNGYCYVYDSTLSNQLANLNIAHGQAGGFYSGYSFKRNGIAFPDLDNDGHGDLIIAGATGYADAFLAGGFTGPTEQHESGGTSTAVAITSGGSGSSEQIAYWSDPVTVTVGGFSGSLTLSGSGALINATQIGALGSLNLGGSGNLTGSGSASQITSGSINLTGEGGLLFTALPVIYATGVLQLDGSGQIVATGTSALTASGLVDFSGASDLALTGVAQTETSGTLNLTGSGSLTVQPQAATSGSLNLSGSGLLALQSQTATSGSLDLAGSGSLALSGSAAEAASGALSLSGSGSLTLQPQVVTTGSLDLAGFGQLTASGSSEETTSGSLNLSGSGSLTTAGGLVASSTISLTGAGTLAYAAFVAQRATVAFTGSGLLTSASTITSRGQVNLNGSGILTTIIRPATTGTTSLSGLGTLSTQTRPATAAQLALTGGSLLELTGYGIQEQYFTGWGIPIM